MSDELSGEQKQLKSNPKVAFSEKLDEFRETLDSLYITKNASGRNKFREKWPDIAFYIFGPTLIEFDNNGTPSFEERQKLEDEANLRRIDLKRVLSEFEEKSVEAGFLKLDYIGTLIDQIGPSIAIHMYAENIIERARPGLLSTLNPIPVTSQSLPEPVLADEKLTSAEIEILRNVPPPVAKPLPPKGTLRNLFNWISAQRPQGMQAAQ